MTTAAILLALFFLGRYAMIHTKYLTVGFYVWVYSAILLVPHALLCAHSLSMYASLAKQGETARTPSEISAYNRNLFEAKKINEVLDDYVDDRVETLTSKE